MQIDAIGFNGSKPFVPRHPELRFGAPGVYDYFPAVAPAVSGRMTVVFGQSSATESLHTTAQSTSTSPGDYFAAAIDPDFKHVWIHGNLGARPPASWTSVVGEFAVA